jgi:hypothetical protein
MTVNALSRIPEPKGELAQKSESSHASFSSSSDPIKLVSIVHHAHLVSDNEHVALLESSAAPFKQLQRKDELFDDGVAAIFGIVDDQAELLGFSFQGESITSAEAMKWLAERRFPIQLFVSNSGETSGGGGATRRPPVNPQA